MQDAARAHWLAMVGDGGVPDMEEDDFGFNNDFETAMEIGDVFLLTNYQVLPRAGSWNDQFQADTDDLITNLRGLAWARSIAKESEHESIETQGETSETGIPDKGNWKNLL